MAPTTIASHAGPPSKVGGNPSATLYLHNLNDKLRKVDLQKELYSLFTTYGRVLDVNVMAGSRMRGQAHIVFPDVQASTQAMRELQGFNFHGRDIKIDFGKTRSHVFDKLEGEYKATNNTATEQTGVSQQSVFEAPRPGQVKASTEASAGTLLLKTDEAGSQPGTKRPREEEEEEEEEEAPMDEDEDEDVEMEQSDED